MVAGRLEIVGEVRASWAGSVAFTCMRTTRAKIFNIVEDMVQGSYCSAIGHDAHDAACARDLGELHVSESVVGTLNVIVRRAFSCQLRRTLPETSPVLGMAMPL